MLSNVAKKLRVFRKSKVSNKQTITIIITIAMSNRYLKEKAVILRYMYIKRAGERKMKSRVIIVA